MYTPRETIEQKRARAAALRQSQPDWTTGSGLAHIVNQIMAGRNEYGANQAEKVNQRLGQSDANMNAADLSEAITGKVHPNRAKLGSALGGGSATFQGDTRYTPQGQQDQRSLQAAMLAQQQKTEQPRKSDLVTAILPDGSNVPLSHNAYENVFTTLQGQPFQIPEGTQIVEGTNATDTLAGFMPQKFDDLENMELAINGLVSGIDEAVAMVQENPDITTLTSRAASILNGVRAEAKAAAGILGLEFDESLFNIAAPEYEDSFRRMGIDSDRLKGLVVGLAYARARQLDPGGRLSTPDVKYAMDELGVNASDPQSFITVLNDVKNRSLEQFKYAYRLKTGEDYGGELQSSEPPQGETIRVGEFEVRVN